MCRTPVSSGSCSLAFKSFRLCARTSASRVRVRAEPQRRDVTSRSSTPIAITRPQLHSASTPPPAAMQRGRRPHSAHAAPAPAPPTTWADLPPDLMGLIYSKLGSEEDRRSMQATCRASAYSPAVRALFKAATFYTNATSAAAAALAAFPGAHACLCVRMLLAGCMPACACARGRASPCGCCRVQRSCAHAACVRMLLAECMPACAHAACGVHTDADACTHAQARRWSAWPSRLAAAANATCCPCWRHSGTA